MPTPRGLFSEKAQEVLAHFEMISETNKFIAEGGPLETEIRAFLVSVARMLKRDCKIQDWKQDFPANDDGDYISVQIFPKEWQLLKLHPVAFRVTWSNPFLGEPEDLSVELQIPLAWIYSEGLRDLVDSQVPEGFTNVYDGDADKNTPYWRYVSFQPFVIESRFDVIAFYQAILSAFSKLLSLRPIIDEYVSHCPVVPEVRTPRRELGVFAVVDVETAGSAQELIEICVVNAAYDKHSGEVLGILDQYEGLREPKCGISKANLRFNGLGIEEVRGRTLDEERIRALLVRADFIVAHNSAFDKARVSDQFKWAADLDWRDSWNSITWNTDETNLPFLLEHHGIDCGTSHRACCDAQALLELLSYGGNKPYLAQLLTDSAAVWAK
jgi:DNA polymerase-3 subunit epsilon